ncbi:MAG: thioredoxin family protein [Candidatus Kariarchaeaceae archaeon]|jgi:hypothetical protein
MVQLQEDLINSIAMNYEKYLTTMTDDHLKTWKEYLDKINLDDNNKRILQTPSLPINIIVFSGAWCPECALAVAVLLKMEELSSFVQLRIVDRDASIDLYEPFMPNNDKRVPVVLFCSDDYYVITSWVERSAKKYGLLWDVLQKNRDKGKEVVIDQLRSVYEQNSDSIIQSTIDELFSELTRTIGVINYSSRLQTAL